MKKYNYIINYGNDKKTFSNIEECVPYINEVLKHNIITKNILNDYLYNPRKRHQKYFKDFEIQKVLWKKE